MAKRIIFTGGSGKAGRHVLPYLADQGYKILNLDLTPLDHPGIDNLIVDITDSGHGVEAKEKDKLFDPFFSTKKSGEGTGLGLSVTRSIVEMHRGMITLKNRDDDNGARVRLAFPTSQDHETKI